MSVWSRFYKKKNSLPDYDKSEVLAQKQPDIREYLGRLKLNKKSIFLATFLTVFFTLFFLSVLFAVIPGFALYRQGNVLLDQARTLKDSATSQDLVLIETEYGKLKNEFLIFEERFEDIYWMRKLPVLGGYVQDARHGLNAGLLAFDSADIALQTIKPYADIVGLGVNDSPGGQTANDRIEFLVNTIDEIRPELDKISQRLTLIKSEISRIELEKYPEELRGRPIRQPLKLAFNQVNSGIDLFVNSQPLVERAPYLLGVDETRKYLLLFQNDKELRPTGGFLTAYSLIDVTNGKIGNTVSSDIYDLDSRYTPRIQAPEVIREYLKGPYLISENYRLRDMNWNPDFVESMELFFKEAKLAGIGEVDGIIAVDTHVVKNLLDVIGPISVPGYGEFSTNNDERCNCPQVIYELESFADVEGPVVWNQDGSGEIIYAPENYGRRKEIIGPLMNAVLNNALGQPKEKMDDLFQAALRSLLEKHVLILFFDTKAQSGAESANLSGRIKTDYVGDYLHINDSNLGGRKSNLYVTHEVFQKVDITSAGEVVKELTITYTNPQDFDGWLNSVLPNWTRVYVPQNAKLISAEGFDEEVQVYEEHGKTVFAGGFELRPKGIKKINIKYSIPNSFENEYRLFVQKQPGKDFILHTIEIGNRREETFLRTDREFYFQI